MYASDRLQKVLRRQGINCYYTSQGNLKDLLGSSKDRLTSDEKSGIYELDCKCCDLKYRGQTRRKSIERYKEHRHFYNSNKPERSAMAKHCIEEHHEMGGYKLLKEVKEPRKLDAWESLLIGRSQTLVNIGFPPILSSLFSLSLNDKKFDKNSQQLSVWIETFLKMKALPSK